MVKISRLETDVIKIQKKVNSVFEMLVVAINAVVLKADKKILQYMSIVMKRFF